MAATKGQDANGCQFFVSLGEAPWLDGKHVAFGRVSSGLDARAIEERGRRTDAGAGCGRELRAAPAASGFVAGCRASRRCAFTDCIAAKTRFVTQLAV